MPSIPLFTFQKSNKKGTYMYKVEAIINNVNAYFFCAMQDNDYYIVDGGENFIVLEHSKNKSKIRIYETKAGYFYVDFRNGLDIRYFAVDMYLGQIEDLSIKSILDTIHDKNFQDFCNDYKNVKIHEGTNSQHNINTIVRDIDLSDTQLKIRNLCDKISEILIYKNKKYGNSAIEPNGIFYKGNARDSILIRLDDKIGRIKNNNGELRTNDIVDIIGYLILLLVVLNVGYSELEKLKD